VNLDGNETLNPWDLPEGEKTPSKEKIAFLTSGVTQNRPWRVTSKPANDNPLKPGR
jgi:hypothetical protein